MGELAALSASAVWAVASLFFAQLGVLHSPMVLNLWKGMIAGVLLTLTMFLLSGEVWPPQLLERDMWILALSGIIGISIGDTAYFHALTRIGPRRTTLISALVPPVTAVFAFFVLDESITFKMTAGMVLTIGGVVWVIRERSVDSDADGMSSAERLGVGLALVAVVCQAAGSVLTKLGAADVSALGMSVVRILFGTLGLGLFVALGRKLIEVPGPVRKLSTASKLLIASLLGTYLGIWLLNAGLKYTSHTGIAATLSSTSPIFILPLAHYVMREKLSQRSIVGAFIAVLGIAVLFVW